MDRLKKKRQRRLRIKRGIRGKILGSAQRPRLTIYRSNSEIYAQVINDEEGHTLLAASSLDDQFKNANLTKTEVASQVGKMLAERAGQASIKEVVFDRNGYLYHGRVKALAEGVREGGLKL